jgi:hypothetical protein
MGRGFGIAAGVLLLIATAPATSRADAASSGSMSIPVSLVDLAAAAGIHRVDPATLPIDLVRIAFSSPDKDEGMVRRRAAIAKALDSDGDSGDRVPDAARPPSSITAYSRWIPKPWRGSRQTLPSSIPS